jgi:glycosyltransferase involved in cell wall biosynthesis
MWGFSMCCWLINIKSVYTFHNVFPTRLFSYPYHLLLRFSAKKIFKCKFQTISDSVFDHELSLYFNRTTKIYNWFSRDRFYPATLNEKVSLRLDLNLPANALILISVGSCTEIKRHSDIIKSIRLVVDNFPNLVYLHLGSGDTEPEEIALAVRLNILKNIRFCNNQQDVRRYLVASDVYIMPSKFEGIPITTIEAMACGIPTILYNVPGLRDFNKYGQNSILIKDDYVLMAHKIINLYRNRCTYDSIASNALAYVNEAFNINKNADEIYQMYLIDK